MIEPHGGDLVDRSVDPEAYTDWRESVADEPAIRLDDGQFQDAVSIATGRFSPLTGFMRRDDFLKVVQDMTLEDGTVWPLPIVLDVDAAQAGRIDPGDRVPLEGGDGGLVGFIDVDEVYKYNAEDSARQIYGSDSREHPGVQGFLAKDDFFVGGKIAIFERSRQNDRDLRPAESRILFRHEGWDTVVGFQTRNAPHRGHEYIQKCALEQVDGLLVQPKLGEKKAGDYTDDTIVGAYEQLMDSYYPEHTIVLSVFPSRMRYAGPREAVFDAIVRKNQGCTHFIIGRDHAGVGDFYDGDAAHHVFDEIGDLGIEPMLFEHAFYCEVCDGMCSDRICPHGDDDRVYPSGSKIREQVRAGESPTPKMMRPEVSEFLMNSTDSFVE